MIPSIEDFFPNFTGALLQVCQTSRTCEKLIKSMQYSLEAGGKRIRPLLTMVTCAELGGNIDLAKPAALAIEMIHTYSLIHDDLPSMDDDDLRRGKPTNHIEFGEATAILAGDALQTLAFELLSDPAWELEPSLKVQVIQNMASASGSSGMVAGQSLDLEFENQECTLEQLQNIHTFKTGKLLQASILSGAIIAGTNQETQKAMLDFGYNIGLAFQVADDILDITESSQTLGKNAGSDIKNNKSTYPALLGLEGAKAKRDAFYQSALQALSKISTPCPQLRNIAEFIVQRHS